MIVSTRTFEKDLFLNVSVSTRTLGYGTQDEPEIDAKLELWRKYNKRVNLTGGLLASSAGIVLILEGQQRAIAGFHRHAKCDPWHDAVQVVGEHKCLKRRFAAWPLACVGPSRWVDLAMKGHALDEIAAPCATESEFLVDLVLSFVGEGL